VELCVRGPMRCRNHKRRHRYQGDTDTHTIHLIFLNLFTSNEHCNPEYQSARAVSLALVTEAKAYRISRVCASALRSP